MYDNVTCLKIYLLYIQLQCLTVIQPAPVSQRFGKMGIAGLVPGGMFSAARPSSGSQPGSSPAVGRSTIR